MHAHVPPIDDMEPMKEVLMLFAANGITTIRGMLGHPRHLEGPPHSKAIYDNSGSAWHQLTFE